MIITIIILSILLIVSFFIIWNLLRKLEVTEDDNEFMMDWIYKFNSQITHITKRADEIDRKGLFKSDDETGSMFKDLKSIIDTLKTLLVRVNDE